MTINVGLIVAVLILLAGAIAFIQVIRILRDGWKRKDWTGSDNHVFDWYTTRGPGSLDKALEDDLDRRENQESSR